MNQIGYLVAAAVGGLATYLVSRLIIQKKLSGDHTAFKVLLPDGVQKTVEIVSSPDATVSFRIQQILDNTVKQADTDSASPDLNALAVELEAKRQSHPLSCDANFGLARVYRRLNDLPKAIDTLSGYIAAKESAGERDGELAAAYYNRGCIEARLHGDQEFCMDDLRRAIAINGAYRDKILSDPDLAAIQGSLGSGLKYP
jgi:hypothetical protein